MRKGHKKNIKKEKKMVLEIRKKEGTMKDDEAVDIEK